MARYRALTDIFTPAPECRYAMAGDILSDAPGPGEVPIPVGWRCPTHAVDPLDPAAMEAYRNEGPRFSEVEIWRAVFTNGARWSDKPVSAPKVYWVPVDPKQPEKGYRLNTG
jgi:hypothetical protein